MIISLHRFICSFNRVHLIWLSLSAISGVSGVCSLSLSLSLSHALTLFSTCNFPLFCVIGKLLISNNAMIPVKFQVRSLPPLHHSYFSFLFYSIFPVIPQTSRTRNYFTRITNGSHGNTPVLLSNYNSVLTSSSHCLLSAQYSSSEHYVRVAAAGPAALCERVCVEHSAARSRAVDALPRERRVRHAERGPGRPCRARAARQVCLAPVHHARFSFHVCRPSHRPCLCASPAFSCRRRRRPERRR